MKIWVLCTVNMFLFQNVLAEVEFKYTFSLRVHVPHTYPLILLDGLDLIRYFKTNLSRCI